MALIKTSRIAPRIPKQPAPSPPPRNKPTKRESNDKTTGLRHQSLSQRVAAATEELSRGLTEAAAATKQLNQSMEQIASGAEEAAGASQEQSSAIKRILASFATARMEAEMTGRRSELVQSTFSEANIQISASVRAVKRNSERQVASVSLISELERGAKDIGGITQTVSRISDQTNLLALNAAIEAARAGDHGRGFAVVADEVRTLAETSDRNAQEVQKLAESIQSDIGGVVVTLKDAADAAAKNAKNANAVIDTLDARRADVALIVDGSREVVTAALEAERAATEAQKGAEQIAAAAEEQSSGASEAQSAVEQQAKALEQSQLAGRGLGVLTNDLRDGKGGRTTAEQIGATAEELSATIQELSGAASQVMAAVEQISRASQIQAGATQETSAALAQIETSAKVAQNNGTRANERVATVNAALNSGRGAIENLMQATADALKETLAALTTVTRLERAGRKIEKFVDAIALTAIQTSMLAVSGSVEAARAGDAGRGFAVVSADIRNLARETSENVERAKDGVREILDQIAMLKRDLEQIAASSEIEVQNNRAVSASLQSIGREVEALNKASSTIVQGAGAILLAVEETAKGARQVAAAAEQANAASRQAATAATEQSRGAEDLAAAIEEIASLADELKHDAA